MPATEFPTAEQLGDGAADAIRGQFDEVFRQFFSAGETTQDGVCFTYITGEAHPLGNAAVMRGSASAGDVSRGVSALVASGLPSAVVLMDDENAAQAEATLGAGYARVETMPLMSVGPESLAGTELAEGYTFREVSAAEDGAWCEAVSEGYGLPLGVGRLFGPARGAGRLPAGVARHFVAERGGEMVSTSMLYVSDGMAGIYGVATRVEHRGKGLAAYMASEPLRLAWGEGYRMGVLQASEMGAPVYRRIGYVTLGNMGLYVRVPDG